jgi:hypothetical protein
MKLMVEATDMIRSGITLNARRMVARRGRPVAVSPYENTIRRRCVNGRYVYEVIDRSLVDEGVTSTYVDLEEAAWAFADQVGWVALGMAVATHRYEWMFPAGSTLDWHTRQAHRLAA